MAGLERAFPLLASLVALGPEILTSPSAPTTQEHLNVEEVIEGPVSEKPCTGVLVCVYCTSDVDLSLYLSPNSPSVHTLWSWACRGFCWTWELETCITAGPCSRECPGWDGLGHFFCPFVLTGCKNPSHICHHKGQCDLWAAGRRDACRTVLISPAEVQMANWIWL